MPKTLFAVRQINPETKSHVNVLWCDAIDNLASRYNSCLYMNGSLIAILYNENDACGLRFDIE
jgi:hypothetical protein